MTKDESAVSSRQQQIDASLADYASRMSGIQADPDVLSRAIATKVQYKDPYQYERDAKAVVNQMIQDDQRFTLSDEMLQNEDYHNAQNPIKPITEKGLAQRFDDYTGRFREEMRHGFGDMEMLSSWTPDGWKEPELRGKKGMGYIAGQAMALVVDNVALGGIFKGL